MAIYTVDAQIITDEFHTIRLHSPQTQHTSLLKTPETLTYRRDALWGNAILFRYIKRV